jgi:hypothetical protein
MAGDDPSWALNMTEPDMMELLTNVQGDPDGPKTVAILIAARARMRPIPQLHGPFAALLLKAIERIAAPVPVTATNLSSDSKTESAVVAQRPSGSSAVVSTNISASDRMDTGSEENEWALVTPEMGFESHHVADKASFKKLFSEDRQLVRVRVLAYIDFRSHPFCIYSGQWVSSNKGEMG